MKIEHKDFLFEESLKYLDELAQQLKDGEAIPEIHNLREEELPVHKVVTANCFAHFIVALTQMGSMLAFPVEK